MTDLTEVFWPGWASFCGSSEADVTSVTRLAVARLKVAVFAVAARLAADILVYVVRNTSTEATRRTWRLRC